MTADEAIADVRAKQRGDYASRSEALLADEVESLRAENAVLEAKLSSFDNIEKMSIVSNKLAELDWFRRREREVLERLFRKNADDGRFATLLDWEEANPRPGGGT